MCQALRREGEKKAETLNILMAMTEKKINLKEKKTKLEEKKVGFTVASKDTKILTMRIDELDDDVALIMCAICVKML